MELINKFALQNINHKNKNYLAHFNLSCENVLIATGLQILKSIDN